MSPVAIALRLLLILALVLDGIGGAAASARMASVPAHDGHAAALSAHNAHAACHHAAHAQAGARGQPAHDRAGGDCCHAGLCDCHCMQQAQLAFALPVLAMPGTAQASAVRAMHPAHESPRLPQLTRPPIGRMS